MQTKAFYDNRTYTLTYAVYDPETRDAIVIDPVLDYEPASSHIWTESVEVVLDFLKEKDLNLRMILETHAHADHLSGSQILKKRYPNAQIAISERITTVQRTFKQIFDLPDDFPTDGRQFDRLLKDREVVEAGSLRFEVIFTPGHTPACASYKFDDAIFTGDALFMPDMGTGRCDFPAGSAQDLYHSVHERLYSFPDHTRVFVGHDYQPGGRPLAYESTIGEEKAYNIQLPYHRDEATFVEFRTKRDKSLAAPKLLFQSVQVNVDAGKLPQPHENNIRYLKIPVNVFRPEPKGDLELQDI